MTCINHYVGLTTLELAEQLIHNGVPDDLTRMFAWLRAFGFAPPDLDTFCEDIRCWVLSYRRSRDMFFSESDDTSKLLTSGIEPSDTEETKDL